MALYINLFARRQTSVGNRMLAAAEKWGAGQRSQGVVGSGLSLPPWPGPQLLLVSFQHRK